MREVGQMSKA